MKANRNTKRGRDGLSEKYQTLFDSLTQAEKGEWRNNGKIER